MKPLPANLPPLPEHEGKTAVLLGWGGSFELGNKTAFRGWKWSEEAPEWEYCDNWGGMISSYIFAAPAHSEVVRLNAQPTTVLGWLETMPEPWRGQAIANLPNGRSKVSASSVADAIVCFPWDKEGLTYWQKVRLHFLTGSDLPSPETAANYVAPVEMNEREAKKLTNEFIDSLFVDAVPVIQAGAPVERPLVSLEKKYRYRGGKPARLLCIDAPGKFPVISMKETGTIIHHRSDGSYYSVDTDSSCDLVEVRPEPRELWVSFDDDGCRHVFLSKESADLAKYPDHKECVHFREATA